ncbi:HGxxPAAW family protein [Demetria terragena]|uniref:HGxxPAAW family protein n=1 Tax=Demetria terragena TaxID=63959 RepID=UPI00036BC47C|nr:HGxxPAAW family protein [Demetria terragena]
MAEVDPYHGSTDDHGASTAAWSGVLALILASGLIAVGVYINNDLITVVGVVVGVLGLVGAIVMAKLGFGVAAKRREMADLRASGSSPASHH